MNKPAGKVKNTPVSPKQPKNEPETINYQNLFISSALSMSWQLAIVVLIPLIGGYEIDKHLHSSPVFLLVGVVAALVGSIGVVYLSFKQANQKVGK
jgi:F0F1-type ATP synthase assembly protein I